MNILVIIHQLGKYWEKERNTPYLWGWVCRRSQRFFRCSHASKENEGAVWPFRKTRRRGWRVTRLSVAAHWSCESESVTTQVRSTCSNLSSSSLLMQSQENGQSGIVLSDSHNRCFHMTSIAPSRSFIHFASRRVTSHHTSHRISIIVPITLQLIYRLFI